MSVEYAWQNIFIVVGGVSLVRCQKISYKATQEKELSYGIGANPHSIQRGNKSYEGSIDVLKSDFDTLVDFAPNNSLLDMEAFSIVVAYVDAQGVRFRTDTLEGCEFKEEPTEASQGDKQLTYSLPFIALNIKYNS